MVTTKKVWVPAINTNTNSKGSNAVGVPVNRKALAMILLMIVARMPT